MTDDWAMTMMIDEVNDGFFRIHAYRMFVSSCFSKFRFLRFRWRYACVFLLSCYVS